jgi:hypothetical protein
VVLTIQEHDWLILVFHAVFGCRRRIKLIMTMTMNEKAFDWSARLVHVLARMRMCGTRHVDGWGCKGEQGLAGGVTAFWSKRKEKDSSKRLSD